MEPESSLQKTYLAILAVSLPLTVSSFAQSTWTGLGGSNWSTAGSWNPGGVPAAGTNVIIASSSTNATIVNSTLTRNGAGNTTITDSGSLTITGNNDSNWDILGGGSTTISGNGKAILAGNATTDGSKNNRFQNRGAFEVSGNGSLSVDGAYFLVGFGGAGAFTQSGGSVEANLRRGFFLSDGASGLGSTYTLSGGSLTVNSHANGLPSDGNFYLRGVFLGKANEGDFVTALANPNQTGDTLLITGGTANFTKSSAGNNAGVLIARNSSLVIEGGNVSFNGYDAFRVGQGLTNTGGNGLGYTPTTGNNNHITVSGGTLDITGGTNLDLGYADNGTLNLSGGVVTLEGLLNLGRSGGSALGSVFHTAGTLFAKDIVHTNGTYTFSGGDIYLNGDRTAIINEAWFDGTSAWDDVVANYDTGLDRTHIFVIPEPGISALGALGVFLLVRRRR